MTDQQAQLQRCRMEHQRWARDLGEAVAEAVTRRLEEIPAEVLAAVDPEIVTEGLVASIHKDPTCAGILQRARRWRIAEHETLRGSHG